MKKKKQSKKKQSKKALKKQAAYRKAYNAKRRKLYAYWRDKGYRRKFIRMKGLTSEVNSLHFFRRYKTEHKGEKLVAPVELSKKQMERLEKLAKAETRISSAMKQWNKLGAVERAYRLENMRRFYKAMAKASGKSVTQLKAEFLRDVKHVRTQNEFYKILSEQYSKIVGVRLT